MVASPSRPTWTMKNSFTLPKTPLFGTDGIRGKVGELLNAELALQVGYHAGQILKELSGNSGPIIIGQDSRNSSEMLTEALSAGLMAQGVEVWNLGLCPTPCVAYLTRSTPAIGGIMVSASHNPPEDNGIKFFTQEGTKLTGSATKTLENEIRKAVTQKMTPSGSRSQVYRRSNLIQTYQQQLHQSLPHPITFEGMKIVLDLAFGASVNLAPSLFTALGAEVIALHNEADGNRINVNCGSTHLHQLQQAMITYKADLGFAFDGDADRVMAVDSQGRVVDGDYILYLWGKELQAQQALPDNLIIATVMANLGFEKAWQKQGGKLLRTAVGDQNVQTAMWETGSMLGGEQSGHILCHHHGVSGDGVQTALHLTALVKQSGLSLAELVNQSFTPYPQFLKNVRVEDREQRLHWQDNNRIRQALEQAETALFDRGRVLVRASGTEPLIRVMVEAEDSDLALYWTDHLVSVIMNEGVS